MENASGQIILTAGLGDPQAIQQLEQIRQRAEAQLQTMTMLMSGAPESAETLLRMAYARLQEQIQLAAGIGPVARCLPTPQVAEANPPRPMDAAERSSLYDGFMAGILA